jgi:hypothetical protein
MLEVPVKLNLLAKGRVTGDRAIVTALDSTSGASKRPKNAKLKVENMIGWGCLRKMDYTLCSRNDKGPTLCTIFTADKILYHTDSWVTYMSIQRPVHFPYTRMRVLLITKVMVPVGLVMCRLARVK